MALRRTSIRAKPADNHLSAAAWEEQFQMLLSRCGGLCEAGSPRCLGVHWSVIGLPRERVSVQHRRAQGMGGTSDPTTNNLGNLLLFCGSGTAGCHGWVETEERGEAERRGLWVRHTPTPVWEVPVVLPSGRRVLLHPTMPVYLPHPEPWDWETLTAARA